MEAAWRRGVAPSLRLRLETRGWGTVSIQQTSREGGTLLGGFSKLFLRFYGNKSVLLIQKNLDIHRNLFNHMVHINASYEHFKVVTGPFSHG